MGLTVRTGRDRGRAESNPVELNRGARAGYGAAIREDSLKVWILSGALLPEQPGREPGGRQPATTPPLSPGRGAAPRCLSQCQQKKQRVLNRVASALLTTAERFSSTCF